MKTNKQTCLPDRQVKNKFLMFMSKRHVTLFVTFFMLIIIFGFKFSNSPKSNLPAGQAGFNADKLLKTLSSSDSTNYTWLISGPNSWENLQTFLPQAKMSGITVMVALLPPSKTPPIDPNRQLFRTLPA